MREYICEVCGNDYDKPLRILAGGETRVFDSFECAIHAMAPRCSHCGIAIVGHGMECEARFYCCAHCAAQTGVLGMRDGILTEKS
jgi:3-hydroxyisobutyrate dehydrogenase-like beta-hydroxyacid dehydrogenase